MPQLEELKKLEDRIGFRIFLVNFKGHLGRTRSILKENGITIPVLLDCSYYSRDILQVNYTPTTFVVDREGVIRARMVGGSADLIDIILNVLDSI